MKTFVLSFFISASVALGQYPFDVEGLDAIVVRDSVMIASSGEDWSTETYYLHPTKEELTNYLEFKNGEWLPGYRHYLKVVGIDWGRKYYRKHKKYFELASETRYSSGSKIGYLYKGIKLKTLGIISVFCGSDHRVDCKISRFRVVETGIDVYANTGGVPWSKSDRRVKSDTLPIPYAGPWIKIVGAPIRKPRPTDVFLWGSIYPVHHDYEPEDGYFTESRPGVDNPYLLNSSP